MSIPPFVLALALVVVSALGETKRDQTIPVTRVGRPLIELQTQRGHEAATGRAGANSSVTLFLDLR